MFEVLSHLWSGNFIRLYGSNKSQNGISLSLFELNLGAFVNKHVKSWLKVTLAFRFVVETFRALF